MSTLEDSSENIEVDSREPESILPENPIKKVGADFPYILL
jgi:hypothetical protein